MGLKISDLLKWRTEVKLVHPDGKPIMSSEGGNVENDREGKQVSVWVRIIGDDDLQSAFKYGRIASAKIRKALTDPSTDEWAEYVDPINEASREECIDILKEARSSNLYSEALSNVEREDEIKLSEFAIDPDAPTLEEQEKFDAALAKQNEDYEKALAQYQLDRQSVILAELEGLSDDEIKDLAKREISALSALTTFLTTLQDEKVWRACYTDKTCRERAFDSLDDWLSTDIGIRTQLIQAYNNLEQNPDEIKNSQKEALGV